MQTLKLIKFPTKKDLSGVNIPSFMTNPIIQPYNKQFKAQPTNNDLMPTWFLIAGFVFGWVVCSYLQSIGG